MSKTLNRILLAGAALALLAGCAAPVAAPAAPAAEPAATAEAAPAEAAADGPIRVAVMLPSTINDMSWSANRSSTASTPSRQNWAPMCWKSPTARICGM